MIRDVLDTIVLCHYMVLVRGQPSGIEDVVNHRSACLTESVVSPSAFCLRGS